MNTNRRTFLINVAKGGLALSSLSLLTSCGGVTRSDLNYGTNSAELQQVIGREGVEILHLASLAPNGHNTQPWTVTIVDPNHWTIGTDPARWLPAVDPENREMLLSIGAFLENLIIAAEYYGKTIEINIVAKSPMSRNIAEITLKEASQKRFPPESIRTRRTIRNNLLSKELSSQDVAFITGGDSERFFYFPPGSPQGKYLAEGTLEANRVQTYRDPAQEELADWIRWSNDETRKHRDGLTPASMGITGFAGWYVRTFYDQSDVLKKGFRETTIKKVSEQVQTNGGWLVITSEHGSIPLLLETGRLFQRMFLKVRECMIAIQPMTQMLEEAQSQHEIANALGLESSVQFILRTGYLKSYPGPVSLRRPVSWFTQV
jgi:hypothetical protein